ncbi:hypothetical protein [Sorangium sp. So ce1099]|uniref:hypothetical protein n=1 Tax=Sorangium sp. So ce1099 TaxID=3133331 RepID=UPI003F601705
MRAAARVALGALACGVSVGCGGVHISDEQTPAPDPGEQVVPEAPDGPDPAGHGATAGAGGGGGAAPATGGDVSASSTAGGGTDGAGGSPPGPTELACAEQAGLDDAEARPRAELDCCLDYAAQRVPDATPLSEQQRAALAADASFVNCCTALIVGVGANAISYGEAEPIRGVCCFGDVVAPEQELYAHTFCTPWGPPVPPALDADAASEVA